MLAVLVLALAVAPESIRVEVEGAATEVCAWRDGVLRAVAPVSRGRAELRGLAPGRYDLQAVGPDTASEVEHGVPTAAALQPGFDARLVARRAYPLTVRTRPGATVWWQGRPDPERLPAGLVKLVVDHPGRVASAERLVRVAGPVQLDVPLEAGLVVTGQVVDAGNHPVPGAWIEALVDGSATGRWTSSDTRGRFGLAGVRGISVSVAVAAPGYARSLERVVFYPGEERARVRVRLRPGSSAVVRAVGLRGEPLLDAHAVLLPAWYETVLEEPRLRANYSAERRSGGRTMRFAHLAPGRRYRILLSAPGYRPAATEPFVAPPAGRRIELPAVRLAPGAALEVTAVPPGTVVVVRGREGARDLRAGREGTVRFDGLDPGPHSVILRDRRERPLPIVLEAGHAARLEAAGPPEETTPPIQGEVYDADGRPLPGVEVTAAGRTATSGPRGHFGLEGLPPGRDRFAVAFEPGPDCRGLAQDPHLPVVQRRVAPGARLKIRLERAARVRLRLDPGDRPLARARVRLRGSTGTERLIVLARGQLDFEVEELAEATYSIDVAAPRFLGSPGAVVSAVPGEPEEIVVPLLTGRAARGRVVLRSETPRPLEPPLVRDVPADRGWVMLYSADPMRALAVAPLEADGSFLLEGLPSAPVLICACRPGFPVARQVVDLRAADASDLVFALLPATEAAVRVVDRSNAPLPEAHVRFLTEQGVDLRDLAALARFRLAVAADEDFGAVERCLRLQRDGRGRVAAAFVRPGSYKVEVSAPGFETRRLGLRALRGWEIGRLREQLPGQLPADFATEVRLSRVRAAPRGEAGSNN